MARSFEEMDVWKDARELVRAVYRATAKAEFRRDHGLVDQVRRASVSVMSNIAEGFERDTNKEFSHYLFMAKGSAGELRSQMYVALDLGYLTEKESGEFLERCRIVSSQLAKLIQHVNTSPPKGASRKT